jgi:hypothetical protein
MSYSDVAKAARDWAVTKVGCRYSQAKRTQENIFDCSSFVARAYSAQGKAWKYGGRVPLSCYEVYDDDFELLWPESYAAIGKKFGGSSVIAKATQPGDLQFLCTEKNSSRANKITHVTMVASASKIVHARGTAYGVRTDSITHYAGKVCAVVRYNPSCDLVLGHRGYRTAAMQKALNEHGADLNGDGEFGVKTLAALKAFQQKAGLPVTGRGDAVTLAALGLTTAAEPPADPAPTTGIRVTGGSVNLRTGPGTTYDAVKAVARSTILTPVETDGWSPVLVGGEVLWISKEYTEEVKP